MNILISGASTGVGRGAAVHLAASGHEVWAGVRSQKSHDELERLNIPRLHPVFLDVTDTRSIAGAVSEVKKQGGVLHALINNAGVATGGPIEGLSMAEWRRQFDINFFGPVELTKACLALLRESKGRIVNMSSVSGRISSPYLGPYTASKFALEAFSDTLRREVGKFGVKVAVIEPGPIQTPIWEKAAVQAEQRRAELSEAMRSVYGKSIEKFFKSLEQSQKTAAPVADVVKAVEHALTAREPRARYPVGHGILTLTKLSNVLPDSWMDQLIRMREWPRLS